MVAAVSVRASQAALVAAGIGPADDALVSQAALVVAVESSQPVYVSQAALVVAARGRTDQPKVRAWTFTLDAHDYYVLRAANLETFVYDFLAKDWYVWGSNTSDVWKAYTGINWLGGRELADTYSEVVVGDDLTGALYFLAPNEYEDDDASEGADVPRPFLREVTAQYLIDSGYDSVPCFGVQVFGSVGQTGVDLDVELRVSDDRGQSYTSAGSITLTLGEYSDRLFWPSLGSMVAPGRLFKVLDEGALQRIDFLRMEGESK